MGLFYEVFPRPSQDNHIPELPETFVLTNQQKIQRLKKYNFILEIMTERLRKEKTNNLLPASIWNISENYIKRVLHRMNKLIKILHDTFILPEVLQIDEEISNLGEKVDNVFRRIRFIRLSIFKSFHVIDIVRKLENDNNLPETVFLYANLIINDLGKIINQSDISDGNFLDSHVEEINQNYINLRKLEAGNKRVIRYNI